MPAEVVKKQYVALAKLLKVYRTQPLDQDTLKASLAFCKDLYAAAQSHPDLIFAQPQLYKPQLPFVVNLAFNSTVFTCLLAIRNKFDPSVTLQLMCGSLSNCALEQSAIDVHYQADSAADNAPTATKLGLSNKHFIQLLKANQQHIWLSTYRLCTYYHTSGYPSASLTTPIAALPYMANRLALLCTPSRRKQPISFALAIKHLALICSSRWYSLLGPLLQYPSVTPPGSYLRLKDGALHIVLSLSAQGLVTKPLPTKRVAGTPINKAGIKYTPAGEVSRCYPCQSLQAFKQIGLWWNTALANWLASNNGHQIPPFESILPLQAAPSSLLVIQDQLSHTNADIAVIVKAIENEPAYGHPLQVSASKANRQKQAVVGIQHSLSLLGFERANSILLQHALLSRLNQQYFPLQERLLAFSQFYAFVAEELAAKNKHIPTDLTKTIVYFAVSRLFTLPAIRTMKLWADSALPSFQMASLVKTRENDSLKKGAMLLAKAWQQDEQILAVLEHYDSAAQNSSRAITRQLCYLIGMSLTLAQEHYFAQKTRCEQSDAYFKAGLLELGINQGDLDEVMATVLLKTNVFCQLE